jgi:hypothetical protein
MRVLTIALFLSLFFSCSGGSSDANGDDDSPGATSEEAETSKAKGKLYLRTQMVSYPSSYLNINWIFLGEDGTIVYDPVNGVNPINYAAERANNGANVGTYKIEGDQLVVNLEDGKSTSQRIETRNGNISYIDGGIASLQTGVPSGFKLNGQYAGGAITKNLASSHTYVFHDDGTFSLGRLGSVNTESEAGTAKSEDARSGRYHIKGNTLTLDFEDGTKEKAAIAIMDMGKGVQYLVINQTGFRLER